MKHSHGKLCYDFRHLLYWLHGKKEIVLPLCEKQLDLQILETELQVNKDMQPISHTVKPLSSEEQQVYGIVELLCCMNFIGFDNCSLESNDIEKHITIVNK